MFAPKGYHFALICLFILKYSSTKRQPTLAPKGNIKTPLKRSNPPSTQFTTFPQTTHPPSMVQAILAPEGISPQKNNPHFSLSSQSFIRLNTSYNHSSIKHRPAGSFLARTSTLPRESLYPATLPSRTYSSKTPSPQNPSLARRI